MHHTLAKIALLGRQSKTRTESDQSDATAGAGAAAANPNEEKATMPEDAKKTGATAGAEEQPKKPDKPEAAASAAPAGAAQDEAQVVDLDSVRGDMRSVAYVKEVHDLCALAGQPALAAGFIDKNTKVADVRSALIAAKASSDAAGEISGQVGPEASGAAAATIWDRAVNKANQAVGLKR